MNSIEIEQLVKHPPTTIPNKKKSYKLQFILFHICGIFIFLVVFTIYRIPKNSKTSEYKNKTKCFTNLSEQNNVTTRMNKNWKQFQILQNSSNFPPFWNNKNQLGPCFPSDAFLQNSSKLVQNLTNYVNYDSKLEKFEFNDFRFRVGGKFLI